MEAGPDITVCIVLKDVLQHISEGLPRVLSQNIDATFDVIVIDSGSTDGSLEFVKDCCDASSNLRLLSIDPRDFHHARTRDQAAALSGARYRVFLNGDAVPVDDLWLDHLFAPMRDEPGGVALSYSRQIAQSDIDSSNACRMAFNYGEESLVKGIDQPLSTKERHFFSSVSCCVDTQCTPLPLFPEDLPVNEDMALAARALNAGHKIVYRADSVVRHSHNYGYGAILRRSFDNAVVFRQLGFFEAPGPAASRDGLAYLTTSLRYLRGNGIANTAKFLAFFGCTASGALLGKHQRLLPRFLARRLTVYGTV